MCFIEYVYFSVHVTFVTPVVTSECVCRVGVLVWRVGWHSGSCRLLGLPHHIKQVDLFVQEHRGTGSSLLFILFIHLVEAAVQK